MNAKEYLMNTDEKIYEAVINGYDIRLEEPELLAKMELYAEYKLNNLLKPDVMVRSEQLPCSHCGRPLKEHSKDSKLCPDRMKNFGQGNCL